MKKISPAVYEYKNLRWVSLRELADITFEIFGYYEEDLLEKFACLSKDAPFLNVIFYGEELDLPDSVVRIKVEVREEIDPDLFINKKIILIVAEGLVLPLRYIHYIFVPAEWAAAVMETVKEGKKMDPVKNNKGPVKGAIQEVTSAISALNSPPEPKEAPQGSSGYLSETDEMVAHAVEHLLQALEYLKHDALGKIDQQLWLADI